MLGVGVGRKVHKIALQKKKEKYFLLKMGANGENAFVFKDKKRLECVSFKKSFLSLDYWVNPFR